MRNRRGITLIEMIVVMTMIGLMAAIIVPRLRATPATRVRQAADQLVRDLEQARTRALATRTWSRVLFTAGTNSYAGYLDFNADSVFAQTQAESDSLRAFRPKAFAEGVVFGRTGGTPDVPSIPGTGNITFTNSRIDFDTRGMTLPFGSRGVVYLTHPSDPAAITAVTVTAGGSIRRWYYLGGAWR